MLNFSVTFIITIINITVLFLILKKLLFKPVTKFMTERTTRIKNSIEQAENEKAKAKALLTQYESMLKAAETEAEAIIHSAREQARLDAEKIINEGHISAEEIHAKMREQIETERQAAMAIFRRDAATLVITAAGRLLNREIKNEDNLSFAEMIIKETPFSEAGN